MKTLHFAKPNNLSLLHDELIAALPALAPVRDAQGLGTPVIQVEGTATDVPSESSDISTYEPF